MTNKRAFPLSAFLASLFFAFALVVSGCLIYLRLHRQDWVQTYDTLPLFCFDYLVLPLLWISLAYLAVWLLHLLLPALRRLPVCRVSVRRLLLGVASAVVILYYGMAAGFLTGLFSPRPFLLFLLNHNAVLLPVGILLYYGLRSQNADPLLEKDG